MEDSQQGNDKGKGKVTEKYNVWTAKQSNELLKLMVDATTRGWCNTYGFFSKVTVQNKILPILNKKLGCKKTFSHYQSRLKWFKRRYNYYCELMHQNSEFRWDPVTKKFTASDEAWDNYFKSHPTHKNYRTDTFAEYEDLRITIGNGIDVGRHSIGIGDDTNARTFGAKESRGDGFDDFVYDHSGRAFIQSDQQEHSYQRPSLRLSSSLLTSQPMNSEVAPKTRKRNRTEYEQKSSSFETNNTQLDAMYKLTQALCNITHTIDTLVNREKGCWKVIREIPNLDNNTRFKVLKLLNLLMEMTPEERFNWIKFELME